MQKIAILFLALVAGTATSATLRRTAPDVAAEVARETQENIQIHDQFKSQEDKDVEQEKKVKANKDLTALQTSGKWIVALEKDMKTQMLIQMKGKAAQPQIHDPCDKLKCGALTCPHGFTAQEFAGHCCPYCVNPDIKVEHVAKGATGEFGGKASTFCDDVWCFPTLCTKATTAPTTTNGQCCEVCPAL